MILTLANKKSLVYIFSEMTIDHFPPPLGERESREHTHKLSFSRFFYILIDPPVGIILLISLINNNLY